MRLSNMRKRAKQNDNHLKLNLKIARSISEFGALVSAEFEKKRLKRIDSYVLEVIPLSIQLTESK